ncbi:MAG: hypothetical protein IJT73_02765 [Selenomonadaceae bacterium]|nr:hypothetical protein [Selenomonadaceae bacterium]
MNEKNLQPRAANFKITIDYLSNKIFDSSLAAGQTINDTELERRKKKILSNIQIINCTGKDIHFSEFDRAVLNACISEQIEGKSFTTAKSIFRKLGGGSDLTPSMKKAILESVEKLAGIRIVMEATRAVEKGIINSKKTKTRMTKLFLGVIFCRLNQWKPPLTDKTLAPLNS